MLRAEHLEEQPVGLGIGAKRAVDAPDVLRQRRQRGGMDVEAALLGDMEQLEHGQWPALEEVALAEIHPVALNDEPVDPAPAEAEPPEAEAGLAAGLVLESGAHDPCQRAYVLGGQIVSLHEALDAERARSVAIAHAARDLRLQIEGQALLGAAGLVVEVAAHGPEEATRCLKGLEGLAAQDAVLHELGRLLHAEEELADPQQGVEVAEPAFALFDIRLEQEPRVADPLVPLVALRELRLDEVGTTILDDIASVGSRQLVEEPLVAPEEARLQKRRANGEILLRQLDALLHRAGRVADLETEVPEAIDEKLGHLLEIGGSLVVVQEEQIDVRARCQLASTVAADRRHRDLLAGRRIGAVEEPPVGIVERALQDGIHLPRQLVMDDLGVPSGLEVTLDGLAPLAEAAPHVGQQALSLLGTHRALLGQPCPQGWRVHDLLEAGYGHRRSHLARGAIRAPTDVPAGRRTGAFVYRGAECIISSESRIM